MGILILQCRNRRQALRGSSRPAEPPRTRSATAGAVVVVRRDDPPDDTRILRLKPEHVVRLATRLLANAERFGGLNREDDEAHLHPLPPGRRLPLHFSSIRSSTPAAGRASGPRYPQLDSSSRAGVWTASAARLQQPGGRLDRVSI